MNRNYTRVTDGGRVRVEEDEIDIILTALIMYRDSSTGELKEQLSKYTNKWTLIYEKYWA